MRLCSSGRGTGVLSCMYNVCVGGLYIRMEDYSWESDILHRKYYHVHHETINVFRTFTNSFVKIK
jgi:hypothetical protein